MSEAAGHWFRVSTKEQDEASQAPDVDAWSRSRGYDVRAQYVIHGHSAFKGSKRFDETWERVLEDMRSGKIRVLVVWKQDRIDRKLNTFKMLEQVVEAGGRVEFVTQRHLNDLTTMGGRISLKVQEEIAYAESRDKSDRIKINQAAKIAKGSLVGKPPFAYNIATIDGIKTLEPDSELAPYVRAVFEKIIDGWSLQQVGAWLASEGVPTSQGGEWWPRAVAKMIRSTTYAGRRQDAQGRTVVSGCVVCTWFGSV